MGSTQGVQLSLPAHTCSFPCVLQPLSLQHLLPLPSCEVVLMAGRSRALWGWLGKGLQSTQREFLPLCCDPCPLPAQPGAVVQLQRLQQMERLSRAAGTAINSLCPRSSLPHRECLLLLLALQPFAVSMGTPSFGGQGVLWALQPAPKWAGEGPIPAAQGLT